MATALTPQTRPARIEVPEHVLAAVDAYAAAVAATRQHFYVTPVSSLGSASEINAESQRLEQAEERAKSTLAHYAVTAIHGVDAMRHPTPQPGSQMAKFYEDEARKADARAEAILAARAASAR